jgi:hypothetical protein
VKHRRSMPRILSAIAGWLLAKTHSGSLRGEGSLPIQKTDGAHRVDGGMSVLALGVRRVTCCGKWVSVFDPVQTAIC